MPEASTRDLAINKADEGLVSMRDKKKFYCDEKQRKNLGSMKKKFFSIKAIGTSIYVQWNGQREGSL